MKNTYEEKNFSFTRGKQHECLGMNLDHGDEGVFKVSMIPYIDKIHKDFPEAIEKSAPSPHNDYLFKIRTGDEALYLPEEQAVLFHHSVAQLLFLALPFRYLSHFSQQESGTLMRMTGVSSREPCSISREHTHCSCD